MFLPDNRRFLYQVTNGKENGIYLASLDGKEHRRILQDDSEPRYLPPAAGTPNGYLLFRREQTLMAQPMDPKSMQTNGDVFPAAEQVARSFTSAANDLFSISGSGVLIYRTGLARGGEYQYAWFDRAGKEAGVIGSRVQSIHFALSPDAKRVIIQRVTGSNSDLWMTDLDHKTESRFTFDPSTNERPVWSPDGSQVVFGSTRGGAGGNPDLYQKASNGVGQDQPLLQSPDGKYPFDWSRDGRFLIFVNNSQKTNLDVFALPMSGTGDRKPIRLVQGPFRDWMGQLSPDQRWLAYCSDESGRPEVYVQPFAPADAASGKPVSGKWQISTAGGTQPRWRADGKEFFYVAPDRKLMSVEVKTAGPSFDHSTAQPLFELRANVSDRYVYRYAPAPDGKRFLVSTELEGSDEAQPLTIVVNWLAAIKK